MYNMNYLLIRDSRLCVAHRPIMPCHSPLAMVVKQRVSTSLMLFLILFLCNLYHLLSFAEHFIFIPTNYVYFARSSPIVIFFMPYFCA